MLTTSMSRHIDAVELCFHSFLEDIEKTRPRYPEEEDLMDLETELSSAAMN
jgi:hypothetical protein